MDHSLLLNIKGEYKVLYFPVICSQQKTCAVFWNNGGNATVVMKEPVNDKTNVVGKEAFTEKEPANILLEKMCNDIKLLTDLNSPKIF